jgi:WhiB family redox-sensing transcriptional regulator
MIRPTALRPIAAAWQWQESAACRGADSALFYAPEGEYAFARLQREERARQLCAGCPVREECAEFALATGERHGVWGGTTQRERVAVLRRPRKRASASDRSGTQRSEARR